MNAQRMSLGFILSVSGTRGVTASPLLMALVGRAEAWRPAHTSGGPAPAAELEGRGRSCQRKARGAVEREASGAWRTIGYVQEIRTGKEGPGGRELSVLSPVTSSVYLNRTEGAQEKGRLRIRIQDLSQKCLGGNGIGHK